MYPKPMSNKDILEAVGQWSPEMENKYKRQKAEEDA